MKKKKFISLVALTSFSMLSTTSSLAAQQKEHHEHKLLHYHITDLGTLGGPVSTAFSVQNAGVVAGGATLSNGTEHATLWFLGQKFDIGSPGLGGEGNAPGLSSIAYTVNEFAQTVGSAEPSQNEKDSENFCSFGSGLICSPFLWGGVMNALPTLGGKNGAAVSINDWGLATGVAEENTVDTQCVAPQAHDFQAVLWGPGKGQMQKLRPLPGDSVGEGLWVNNKGQVVGQSGSCGNTLLPPLAAGPHAVLWENGSVTDLGNLGGACLTPCRSPVVGPLGNTPLDINNEGQVVGFSVLKGEETQHAFLWTRETGMKDLGVVKGDYASVGVGINDRGEVVGASFDKTGVPRAFLRRNGEMIDLNTLLPANSPIYALVAQLINERGEIAGFGVTSSGQTHAFLATPCP